MVKERKINADIKKKLDEVVDPDASLGENSWIRIRLEHLDSDQGSKNTIKLKHFLLRKFVEQHATARI